MRSENEFNKKAWEWNEVQIPSVKSQQAGFTVFRLILPFIIAGFLCLWDKLLFGAIVAGIGLLLLVLKFAAPRVHELVLRLLGALGRWLGKVISHITLTIVYGIVFTPVALVARLLGRDSLNLKWLPASRTYWSAVPSVDLTRLFDKPFLLERRQSAEYGRRKKIFRISRAVYHTVLTLFLLNLVLSYLYNMKTDIIREKFDSRPQLSVYQNLSWAEDYFREHHESWKLIYTPFTGWSRKDYSGRYINIKDGLRQTYRASTKSNATLQLYAFGASTMWGTGTRDDYTLPSFLVKRAEEEGISLEATNFGEMGYVSWKNANRLAESCAEGKIPDLVVFYDGAGDTIAKLSAPTFNRVHHNFPYWRDRMERPIQYWFQKHSLVHKVVRRLGWGPQDRRAQAAMYSKHPERVQQLAHEIVTTYSENAAFVRELAEVYGFKVWFFWQPAVATKAKPTAEERNYRKPFRGLFDKTYRAATEDIRSHHFVINLSDAFDNQSRTIYIDWVHKGQVGNQIIANKMYEHIRPTLVELTRSK